MGTRSGRRSWPRSARPGRKRLSPGPCQWNVGRRLNGSCCPYHCLRRDRGDAVQRSQLIVEIVYEERNPLFSGGRRPWYRLPPANRCPDTALNRQSPWPKAHSPSVDAMVGRRVSCLVPGPHNGHAGDPTAGKAPVVLSNADPRVLQLPWPSLAPKLEV